MQVVELFRLEITIFMHSLLDWNSKNNITHAKCTINVF